MNPPQSAVKVEAVKAALLDFQTGPGRYSVATNEPRILFEQAHTVLSLAAGRQALRANIQPHEHTQVQQAARFFIRHAFLRPGADHHTLLGLPTNAQASAIREHYRLLIRLTHPDFATEADLWPPNAAARVNLAYTDLSHRSPGSDHEQQRHSKPQHASTRVAATPQSRRTPTKPASAKPPRANRNPFVLKGLAASAVLAVLGMLLLSTPHEDASLQVVAPAARQQASAQVPDQSPANPPPQKLAVASAPPEALATAPVKLVAEPRLKRSAQLTQTHAEKVPANAMPEQPTLSTEIAPMAPMAPLAVRLSPAEVPLPPAALQETQPLPATPAAAPVPTPRAPLDMQQLRPLFTQLVESLQSGNDRQVQQWIERQAPRSGSAASFAAAYKNALAGGQVTGLGLVKFAQDTQSTIPQIDGVVQLNLQHADQRTSVNNFRVRAYFDLLPNGPRLSKLEAH